MKRISTILILIFALFQVVRSQVKYMLLDSLKQTFKIKEYTLKMDSLYKVPSTVKLFNLFLPKRGIVLISVLPDPEKNGSLWTKINMEEIASEHLLKPNVFLKHFNNNNLVSRRDIRIIKKEKDGYYVANECFTQYFMLANHNSVFNTPRYVLNVGQTPLTIRDMEVIFKKDFPTMDFSMTDYFLNEMPQMMVPYGYDDEYIRMYLSGTLTIAKQKAYQFWTFAPWNVSDGWNDQRGIDRFIYIPDKGIVGGSFDFYFSFYSEPRNTFKGSEKTKVLSKISIGKWMKNVLDERISIAEEL